MIQLSNIALPLSFGMGNDPSMLMEAVCRKLSIERECVASAKVLRRAVDARKKSNVRFVVTALVVLTSDVLENDVASRVGDAKLAPKMESPAFMRDGIDQAIAKGIGMSRPVIVGSGPAGLFAAYALAYAGAQPIVIERGSSMEKRVKATNDFRTTARLDPETNIQFGEGGAGTFSDGKLTTGISDPYIRTVLELFVKAGAPEEILWQAKPHIGTDLLPGIVESMRRQIEALGGEFQFDSKLVGIHMEQGRLIGLDVQTPDGVRNLECRHSLLAIGHSARETYMMLKAAGVQMTPKPFAIGARIEHPQSMIDKVQYGNIAGHPALGPADYKLSCHLKGGRSVFSFCMCPGGQIVAASSQPDKIVVNGMSRFARDSENANSALLVNVTPEDFAPYAQAGSLDGALCGIAFQEHWEKLAFEVGGGSYRAPAQLVGDLFQGVASSQPGDIDPTYPLGVEFTDLSQVLPPFVIASLKDAIRIFGRKLPGFDRKDAVLTGVETRSSAPVRIVRNESMQSVSVSGLFPCGEGTGYAGGIMSSAVDGLRCAEALLAQLTA